jgi:protein-L-isoaspartate(D-aspartate) O-methyltransferase
MIRSAPSIGMTSQRTKDRMIARLREQGIRDEVTLAAISEIPRHIFVDEALAIRAYEDVSLPIGYGQTISQPYIVARMTEILRAGKQLGKVLEIGTGCGYQTAVLSKVASEVFSLERISPLVMKARRNLREARMSNIKLKHADGTLGLPEFGPFEGIIVTAAATHIPDGLLHQIAPGGRLVIPVGVEEQSLYLIEREDKAGEVNFVKTQLEPVRFVPLVNGMG